MHSKDLADSINNTNSKMSNRDPLILDVCFHPGPVYKPLPEPIRQNVSYPQSSTNIDNIKPNFDFEENSPFQEDIMSETFQRWDTSLFQKPKELSDLINKENLVHKYLPNQTDIDKMLEVIQRKVLKSTHLPVKIKEVQAGYLHSPHFKHTRAVPVLCTVKYNRGSKYLEEKIVNANTALCHHNAALCLFYSICT